MNKMKKIVSIYVLIEDLEFLKQKEVSPSALFSSAVSQLQAQEMFIDPDYEWDNNYLLKQIIGEREKRMRLIQTINELNEQIAKLKGEDVAETPIPDDNA
jgi:hypothetical protein